MSAEVFPIHKYIVVFKVSFQVYTGRIFHFLIKVTPIYGHSHT